MNYQVIKTIRKLEKEQRTGVLTCSGGSVERTVFFQSGAAVAASSSSDDERLGEILVRDGVITKQNLDDVSIFVRNGKRLATTLAELKIIDADDIAVHVRAQIREICSRIVIYPPKKLSFRAAKKVDPLVDNPIGVPDIIMEASRRTDQLESMTQSLVEDSRILKMNTEAFDLMQSMELKPHEAFILSRISGQEPAQAVFSLSPLPEDLTARALVGHLAVGTLVLQEEETGLALAE